MPEETRPPRRWHHDHDARARPARSRRRPDHVRRARRPGDAPVRPQPGLPRRCRAHRLHTLVRAAKHGFTLHSSAGVTAWRGSPWFFIGWQFALCAIAVLVALLRGAEGRVRSRIIRALGIALAAAVIMLVLAGTGGFTHAVTA